MNSYTSLMGKSVNVDVSSLIGLQSEGPTKKIAVLFTDMVDSTQYFKKHGDKAGRDILHEHYEAATSVINEYGGKLIKALGDSVMAYFVDPVEAFKSAVKMQELFKSLNRSKDAEHQMQVRIGIHYGAVIIEEKDIYGDVVNIASKLTNMAKGNEIYISQEMYNNLYSFPLVHFELVNTWERDDISKDLSVYRVTWEAGVELDPAVDTVLYLRPLWKLCGEGANEIWDAVLGAENELWGDKTKGTESLPDKSLLMTLKESKFALTVADNVFKFLREKSSGEQGDATFPVQMIIDINRLSLSDDEQVLEKVYNWEDVKPGEVYISSDAYEIVKKYTEVIVEPITKKIFDKIFYKVLPEESKQGGVSSFFMYKQKIVQGEFPPCFYCGSRKHRPVGCPSKMLPELTHALDRLGYLSMEELNELFFKYLLSNNIDFDMSMRIDEKDAGRSIVIAHQGFFELKRVFQLRFFRAIWDSGAREWNKVRVNSSQNDGGLAWLAQDSLRVSDLNRAESILKDLMDRNPDDYRVYCALGYLNIEKENPLQAEHNFNEALQRTSSTPQKIFMLLLLYRVYFLSGDYENARKMINSILPLKIGCIDAIYYDIVLRFYTEDEKTAIQRLIKLIESNRTYFVFALIDPDLAPFSHIINPELSAIFKSMKERAASMLRAAEEMLERSQNMLDEQGLTETESLLLKTRNMSGSESYFNCLDIIHYSNAIISICRNNIIKRKRALLERFTRLNTQVDRYINITIKSPYPRLVNSCRRQLNSIREKIHQSQDALPLETTSGEKVAVLEKLCKKLFAETARVESDLQKLDSVQQTLSGLSGFMKRSIVLLSIVFFLGIFIIPPVVSIMPGIDGAESYQKMFLVGGSAVSIAISLFLTIKNILQDN